MMKSLLQGILLCIFSALIFNSSIACSSDDDSDSQSIAQNILVLDSNSMEPIEEALIQVCNNAFFCSNILAWGTTDSLGKITLSFTTSPDKQISESFTVFKTNYRNSTLILDQLEDLSKEIIVFMKMY